MLIMEPKEAQKSTMAKLNNNTEKDLRGGGVLYNIGLTVALDLM